MIKVDGVTKTFEGYKALDNVTCHIPEGCIYGMVGSNGAGKSTLLRLLTGVYKADKGTVEIDGRGIYENPALKNEIAFVPDELYFLNNTNMKRMARLYQSVFPNFDMDRFLQLSQLFRLDIKKGINTFSKGTKRQAATVLAISCRPRFLFLDETFDGLDPVMRNLVKNLICQDVDERKTTAILTSHSLRELEDTCDQLALLHQGGLVFESDIMNLKTSLFKVQIAFLEPYNKSKFTGLELLHYAQSGSVSNMIVKGDEEATIQHLKVMSPVILDILPLTLEEVFTYEMEALGYAFGSAVLEQEVGFHE